MLILSKRPDNSVEQLKQPQWLFEAPLHYFAGEIMRILDIEDEAEIAVSIKRAFQACMVMNIPLNRHFKRVYCFDGTSLIADWKISALAFYLIVVNCNPGNERVAKAQLYFAMHNAENI
ncbi:MAG: hypothetical protein ABJB86_14060 [Bacteroidota bacterium]